MKKKTLLLSMIAFSSFTFAQIGISTPNPQGSFHIDGAKDNPAIGIPNDLQQANDVLVTSTGRVGIGNITPSSNLHITNRGTATGIGAGEATNTGLLIENPIVNNSILSILRTTGATGIKQAVMGINPNFNGNNGVFLIGRTVGGSEFSMDLTTGNIGIATNAPTESLDIAGRARIRTTDLAPGSTIISPLYVDPTGVIVKNSPSSTFGTLTSFTSANISSGATGQITNTMVNGALYKAIVTVSDNCGNIGASEYYVYSQTLNNFNSINGLGGILTGGTVSKSPTFNQTSRDTITTTWTGKGNCAGGGTSIAFDHTLSVVSPGVLQVVNNGDLSLAYRVVLTRIN